MQIIPRSFWDSIYELVSGLAPILTVALFLGVWVILLLAVDYAVWRHKITSARILAGGFESVGLFLITYLTFTPILTVVREVAFFAAQIGVFVLAGVIIVGVIWLINKATGFS